MVGDDTFGESTARLTEENMSRILQPIEVASDKSTTTNTLMIRSDLHFILKVQ